jgi:hypothetical protein
MKDNDQLTKEALRDMWQKIADASEVKVAT